MLSFESLLSFFFKLLFNCFNFFILFEGERERSSIYWPMPQISETFRAQLGQSQEPKAQSRFPTWNARKPSSVTILCCLLGYILTGAGKGVEPTLKTKCSDTGCGNLSSILATMPNSHLHIICLLYYD